MYIDDFKGLYAITDSTLTPAETILLQVEQALDGGVRMLQYRDKSSNFQFQREQAECLLRLCRQAGVPLIINDDVDLALTVGADGVHLGRDDANLKTGRERLGPEAIIGISCYNDFELALQAEQSGADYVAFGRFFASTTKPAAVPAGIELLHRAKTELKIPTVAIGGITPENGAALVVAGADMLAVIQGVFGQPDIRAACNQFQRLFAATEDPPT
ncbi:MAG: thiamine phosphate synthase [Chromatiaceae bacterium]|nr:thiamine phosphate synthase [Gammaproteobacteria bacterium]MCB1879524.1 thiamine phosphate synthase [Gammaproteobacteria bacterium]MCP5427606.1 thiamine phosphate synthase [Chromatiaceae bacterium]MCP5447557.1 thiamine phosphate synthase [Chromatiaceae bacterium]